MFFFMVFSVFRFPIRSGMTVNRSGMTDVLPNAVVLVDDFIAATEHSFEIKLQLCQMRRDIFVFFHDVYCPPLVRITVKVPSGVAVLTRNSESADGTKIQISAKFEKDFHITNTGMK